MLWKQRFQLRQVAQHTALAFFRQAFLKEFFLFPGFSLFLLGASPLFLIQHSVVILFPGKQDILGGRGGAENHSFIWDPGKGTDGHSAWRLCCFTFCFFLVWIGVGRIENRFRLCLDCNVEEDQQNNSTKDTRNSAILEGTAVPLPRMTFATKCNQLQIKPPNGSFFGVEFELKAGKQ